MGKYTRISNRQSWPKEVMLKAANEVLQGALILTTAKKYALPQTTLRRYVESLRNNCTLPVSAGRFKSTFTDTQLSELKDYVLAVDRRAFGITRNDFARLAYAFAEESMIPHRFNSTLKVAGKDFVKYFLQKFDLSLRKPEPTSVARLSAFNKLSVQNYFSILSEIMSKTAYQPQQIYNIDETGCSTVPTKTPLVITPSGKRRVMRVSSAERGTNVSVVCCVSATGHYVPPFFIFNSVRMPDHLLNSAPPGSRGACNPESSFINGKIFLEWLAHFTNNVRPSKQNPILLLMDNHASHLTLESINFCRDNSICLLAFSPHTTHRMQPLDVSFFGPLKSAYSRVCNDFMTANPGETIAVKNVPSLFHKAYAKVATLNNSCKGFEAAGIVPLNSQVFTEEDYEPSVTTDIALPSGSGNNNADADADKLTKNQPVPVNAPGKVEVTEPIPHTSVLTLPTAAKKDRRVVREKLPSLHITSTPVKNYLLEKRQDKETRELKKQSRLAKRKVGKKQKPTRKLFDSDSSDSSVAVELMEDDIDWEDEIEEICMFCSEFGKNEVWFSCMKCHQWAHAACTGITNAEAKLQSWICDFCL